MRICVPSSCHDGSLETGLKLKKVQSVLLENEVVPEVIQFSLQKICVLEE